MGKHRHYILFTAQTSGFNKYQAPFFCPYSNLLVKASSQKVKSIIIIRIICIIYCIFFILDGSFTKLQTEPRIRVFLKIWKQHLDGCGVFLALPFWKSFSLTCQTEFTGLGCYIYPVREEPITFYLRNGQSGGATPSPFLYWMRTLKGTPSFLTIRMSTYAAARSLLPFLIYASFLCPWFKVDHSSPFYTAGTFITHL